MPDYRFSTCKAGAIHRSRSRIAARRPPDFVFFGANVQPWPGDSIAFPGLIRLSLPEMAYTTTDNSADTDRLLG